MAFTRRMLCPRDPAGCLPEEIMPPEVVEALPFSPSSAPALNSFIVGSQGARSGFRLVNVLSPKDFLCLGSCCVWIAPEGPTCLMLCY